MTDPAPEGDTGSVPTGSVRGGAHRSTHREIEWKLSSNRALSVDAIRDLLPNLSVGEGTTYALSATYFDTEDLRLARRGITLRRRTGGHDDGWHLKLPNRSTEGEALDRDEIAVPLLPDDVEPPRELASLVTAFARGRPLRPIGTLRTHRSIHPITAPDATLVGELCRDEVRADVFLPGRDTEPTIVFHEWELEARPDHVEEVRRIVATLCANGFTPSSSTSKLRHALGDDALPPDPLTHDERPGRRRSARDDIVFFLKEQTDVVLVEDHRLRLRLPEAVHNSRVAVRRLRSALRTFAPVLHSEELADLRADLVWAADVLGHERDIEIIEMRLLAALDALPAAGSAQAQQARLLLSEELGERRTRAHEAILDALDSPRWLLLLERLVEVAHDPPTTPRAEKAASRVLPPLASKQWKMLADRAKHLAKDAPAESWHHARISAKRARYAAEACAPAMGREPARFARELAGVTELLGDLQDTDVSRAYLRDVIREVDAPDAMFVLGQVYSSEEQAAERLRTRFPRVWAKASRPRLRRWLRG